MEKKQVFELLQEARTLLGAAFDPQAIHGPQMKVLHPLRDALNKAESIVVDEWRTTAAYLHKHGWPQDLADALIHRLEAHKKGTEMMLSILRKNR